MCSILYRTVVRCQAEASTTDSLTAVSDRFDRYGVPRAFACVIRKQEEGPELLVFDHPVAGTQIPKGRVDEGEAHRDAAKRELFEESGLDLEPTHLIARIGYEFDHPHTGERVEEVGYILLFEAPNGIGESWVQEPDEEAVPFTYRWLSLDERATESVHPHFGDVVHITMSFIDRRQQQIEQVFGEQRSSD